MSQVSIVRDNAILPFPAGQDLTGQEGRPVIVDPGTPGFPVWLIDDPTESYVPIGVIVKGCKAGETASIAIAAGGLAGTVRLKLAAPVTSAGTHLKLATLGSSCAFAPDNGSGARTVMAQALEAGLAEEKIEAVLFKPEFFAS